MSITILTGISFTIIIVVAGFAYNIKRNRENENIRKQQEQQEINETILSIGDDCIIKLNWFNTALTDIDHFFTASEKDKFAEETKTLYKKLDTLRCKGALEQAGEHAVHLYDILKGLEYVRKKHNMEFAKRELEKHKEFFDNILDYPLDEQQRDSIVKLEDNCLVISSAGSGKTSTMVGKLLYLIHCRKLQPHRILTITYTHKASDELTQRLMGTGLSCMTFHKLAMNIVAKVEGAKPSIADSGLFMKVFYSQMGKTEFRRAILHYLTDYKSLVKSEHDYDDSIEYYRDRKKYGVIALYKDKDDRLISTKSEEEKKICSYLTELGVAFKYEEPYDHKTMTEEFRQYKPDFTIYYKDANGVDRKLYLEHYAINASGQVPRWFGKNVPDGWNIANQNYLESIEWKKKLHEKHGTTLIYTTSADFHNKTIRTQLRTLLTEAGVIIKEPTTDELIEKIMSRNKSMENALIQMNRGSLTLSKPMANPLTISAR